MQKFTINYAKNENITPVYNTMSWQSALKKSYLIQLHISHLSEVNMKEMKTNLIENDGIAEAIDLLNNYFSFEATWYGLESTLIEYCPLQKQT